MQAKVIFSKKVGLPGYSSAGATCELCWDTRGNDEGLYDQLLAAYSQAERAVMEQLAHHLGDAREEPAPWAEEDEPAEQAPLPVRVNRLPTPAAAAATKPRARTPNPKTAGAGTLPTKAAHLFPWARKQEEAGYPGALKLLTAYGKENGLGWKMSEWPDDEAAPAAKFVLHELARRN